MASEVEQWFLDNLQGLIISIAAIMAAWLLLKIINKQIDKVYDETKGKQDQGKTLKRIVKGIFYIVVFSIIASQFTEVVGTISGLFAVMGATIIGFASMNTLGNALAGLIIMTNKPIQPGDRIDFEGKFAEVESIQFIFTRIRYLNGTLVSIPNQELLKTAIVNYSKSDGTLGRSIAITLDYKTEPRVAMEDFNQAVKSVDGVLPDPEPKSHVTGLLDYAVQFSCFYRISNIKDMGAIENAVRLTVLEMCQEKGYDLTMPILHSNV